MQEYYFAPIQGSLHGRGFRVCLDDPVKLSSCVLDYKVNDYLGERTNLRSKDVRNLLKEEFTDRGKLIDPSRVYSSYRCEGWDIFYLSLHSLGLLYIEELAPRSKKKKTEVVPNNRDTKHTYEKIAKAFVVRGRQFNPDDKEITGSLDEIVSRTKKQKN